MMKKVFKYALFTAAALSLSACAFAPKQTNNSTPASSQEKKSASNGQVEVKVKSGEYVQPDDDATDSKYLAVELEFKNKTDKKMTISTYDLSVYNSDDVKVEPKRVYDSSNNFKSLENQDLAKDKSMSGYLVFEVEEGKRYDLHYAPRSYSSDEEEPEEIELEVNPSDYPDNVDQAKNVVEDYVNQVFLGGEAKDKDSKKSTKDNDDFVLGGDLEKARQEFRAAFTESIRKRLRHYEFAEGELDPFIDAYIKANAEKANITYTVVEYLPGSIEVKVRPETLALKGFNNNYYQSYYDQHPEYKGRDMNELYKAADKALADEMVTKMDSLPLLTSDSISTDGYRIKFVKKNGKWVLESKEFGYNAFLEVFRGNLS